jgi:hypothetical protein
VRRNDPSLAFLRPVGQCFCCWCYLCVLLTVPQLANSLWSWRSVHLPFFPSAPWKPTRGSAGISRGRARRRALCSIFTPGHSRRPPPPKHPAPCPFPFSPQPLENQPAARQESLGGERAGALYAQYLPRAIPVDRHPETPSPMPQNQRIGGLLPFLRVLVPTLTGALSRYGKTRIYIYLFMGFAFFRVALLLILPTRAAAINLPAWIQFLSFPRTAVGAVPGNPPYLGNRIGARVGGAFCLLITSVWGDRARSPGGGRVNAYVPVSAHLRMCVRICIRFRAYVYVGVIVCGWLCFYTVCRPLC